MTPDAPADSSDEGRVIVGKYRLDRLLGEGGMGSIWRAFNLDLEVPVAIKVLRPDLRDEQLAERLRVEARAAAKLVHPSIVRVFDIGEAESGDPFIVMELLSGESLGSLLERGNVPELDAAQLLLPIAEALALAHSRGVVHRDLKPDNIFLAADGNGMQPKLLDFGIAKVMSSVAAGGPTLTQSGTLLGSPDYMSPEQAYGRSDIDERADVWSFCVVLYEMLAGAAPFEADSCQATLRSVVQSTPVPLHELGVDRGLSDLVERGLVKDRELRCASIFELGQQLAEWLISRGVERDVTGASLTSKWLRSSELRTPGLPLSMSLGHDHATLVSVVNPSPFPSHEPLVVEVPLRRARHWLPTAVVAGAALGGCVAWVSLGNQLRRFGAASPIEVMTAAPAAIAVVAPPAELVDANPVVAPAAPPTPGPAQPPASSPQPAHVQPPRAAQVQTAQAQASQAQNWSTALRSTTKPLPPPPRAADFHPPAGALPAALPAAMPLATRSNRTELLNPY